MEIFAPIQYAQVQTWLQRCKPSLQRRKDAEGQIVLPNDTEASIKSLALVNLTTFLQFASIGFNARPKATKEWREWAATSDFGRWVTQAFDYFGWTEAHIQGEARTQAAMEMNRWTRAFGLSPHSHWRTWITSGFVHREFGHLVNSMMGFWLCAPVCAKIPGMSMVDVGVMAIGSSVFASVAQLIEWEQSPSLFGGLGDRRLAMGASGVVSGFAALAAVAMPRETVNFFGFSMSCSSVLMMQFATDIVALVRARSGEQSERGRPIEHAAHIGGALFGLLYHHLVLRRIRPSTVEERRLGGDDEDLETSDASELGHV